MRRTSVALGLVALVWLAGSCGSGGVVTGSCGGSGSLTTCDTERCCPVCQDLSASCDGTVTCWYGAGSPFPDQVATCSGGKWVLKHIGGDRVDLSVLDAEVDDPRVGTGEPCANATACRPSLGGPSPGATCVKETARSGRTVRWTDGYCQSPCRPSWSDPGTGLHSFDCPSAYAVCSPTSQSSGVCLAACKSSQDCRAGYVCANLTGTQTAACYPIAISECDPPSDPLPQRLGCADHQRCVSYSPDDSYGQCAQVCDPIAQDCAAPQQGQSLCLADLTAVDGSGLCISATGTPGSEGQACASRSECGAGMECHSQQCRRYCRQQGNDPPAPACPMGQTCQDFRLPCGPAPCLTRDKLGICSP